MTATVDPKPKKVYFCCNLPIPIINYIEDNEDKINPRVLLKLKQTCKYFGEKEFPYFVVADFRYYYTHWKCSYKVPHSKYYETVKLEKHPKALKKLWLTWRLAILPDHTLPDLFSEILPKIAVSDVKDFGVFGQKFNLEEFKLMFATVEDVSLSHTIVTYDDGTTVPLEILLQHLLKVKKFRCFLHREMASIFTTKTTHNIVDAITPMGLSKFELMRIPEIFDIDVFATFMENYPHVTVDLYFCDTISAEYSQKLLNYVKKIIEVGKTEPRPPSIGFPGLTRECLDAMKRLLYPRYFEFMKKN